ncbi:MAG TPA: hypothetical protein VN372_11210 [Methanospirillum sp.]|nr:hypothetical protein [Methanospirillum sp.]
MDDIIMAGYNRLIDLISTTDDSIVQHTEEVLSHESVLLEKMASQTAPIIMKVGISILERGKKNNQGEIYDGKYYPKRMLVLGRSAELAPYRPDNINKVIIDQFCVLSEDGGFYEIMYSGDDLIIDSYLGALNPRQVLDLYGYEAVFMLYKAMKQYLENQEALLESLGKTLEFIAAKK